MKYLIMTKRTAKFDPQVIEPHYEFLRDLLAREILELFGPFTDKSGGAYMINAANLEEATAIVHRDPVYTSGSSEVTIYEWNAKKTFA